VTVTLHYRARCLDGCGVLYDGDDGDAADRASNRHTTSKAKGAVQHSSASGGHPWAMCEQAHGWQEAWTDGTAGEQWGGGEW
jgi:hypothetical protein